MDMKKLFEIAGVDTTQGMAKQLCEATSHVGNLKKEEEKKSKASKAADLETELNAVRDEKDLEKKKTAARAMAKHFKVGGESKFLAAVDAAKTPAAVDQLAYNAALKGEGKGTKLY